MKSKINKLISDIIHVSKKTEVSKKKLRIILSVLLTNITVGIDIIVIVIFSSIITGQTQDNSFSFLIDFVLEKKYLLPLLVIIRFAGIYLEKMNIQNLTLQVQENLKMYLIKEIYKKGNFSLSDVNFYSGTLSVHISFFYAALTSLLNSLLQLIIYSAFLIISDQNTFGILLIGIVLLSYPTKKLLDIGRKYMHEAYVISQELGRNIQRVVDNIFLIKILKTSDFEFNVYRKNLKAANKAQYNNFKYGAINSLVPNFITLFIFSVIVAFFAIGTKLTLEFIAVVLRIVQTVGTINSSLNNLINSQVHIEKFRLLEKDIPQIDQTYYKVNPDIKSSSVILKDISFKYFESETFIFKDINIDINKNAHTVITGPNGSGKSTLLGLIAGILIPNKGEINLSSDKFGYIGVSPLIISGTLKENLIYGNNNIPRDDEITDLIREFKLFNENQDILLDLEITNKSLSSGQMQKVSFIRALLANVDILLLDESTSNLDIETKNLIFKILKQKNLTIINATHNSEDFEYDHHLKVQVEDDLRVFKLISN